MKSLLRGCGSWQRSSLGRSLTWFNFRSVFGYERKKSARDISYPRGNTAILEKRTEI